MNSKHWHTTIRAIDGAVFEHSKICFRDMAAHDLAFFADSTELLLRDWIQDKHEGDFARDCLMYLFALRREQERRRISGIEWDTAWQMRGAGFNFGRWCPRKDMHPVGVVPTIPEMLTALSNRFGVLERFHGGGWGTYFPNDIGHSATGATPILALMRLWLRVGDRANHPEELPQDAVDARECRSAGDYVLPSDTDMRALDPAFIEQHIQATWLRSSAAESGLDAKLKWGN